MILVLGALDTKGEEFKYVLEIIHGHGHQTLTIDTGVLGDPAFPPDIPAAQVAEAAGVTLQALRTRGDRGEAMRAMGTGAARLIADLYAAGQVQGLLGMGGSGGTSVFAAAARPLPVGLPKLLVTTLASGDTSGFVGSKDIVLVPSVVDISGLNRISRSILANAAGAICGMVEAQQVQRPADRPVIAASMLGNTTLAVDLARQVFETAGYEVLVFHAIGAGGRTMESLVQDGWINAVFDLTTTELASELVGAPMSAGSERLKAAGRLGIPQVIVPGCMDFSIFFKPETIPAQYAQRQLYPWNPEITLMRTSLTESARLGQLLAERVNAAQGPAAVLLPLKGLSQVGVEGQPFWLPEADQALFEAIRKCLRPDIPLIEMDTHINDPAFARKAAETLLGFLDKGKNNQPQMNTDFHR